MKSYTNKNACNLMGYHAVIANIAIKTVWQKGNVNGILITMHYLLSP